MKTPCSIFMPAGLIRDSFAYEHTSNLLLLRLYFIPIRIHNYKYDRICHANCSFVAGQNISVVFYDL